MLFPFSFSFLCLVLVCGVGVWCWCVVLVCGVGIGVGVWCWYWCWCIQYEFPGGEFEDKPVRTYLTNVSAYSKVDGLEKLSYLLSLGNGITPPGPGKRSASYSRGSHGGSKGDSGGEADFSGDYEMSRRDQVCCIVSAVYKKHTRYLPSSSVQPNKPQKCPFTRFPTPHMHTCY